MRDRQAEKMCAQDPNVPTSLVRKTCLNIECPERKGGECTATPILKEDELREIFFTAAGGISNMANEEIIATSKLFQPLKKQWQAEAQLEIIEYIFRRPTGELTMSVADMKETLDEDWRDEVIQYFFNTESLMMNLDRKREELKGIIK